MNKKRKKHLLSIKQDKAKELGERLIQETMSDSSTKKFFVSDQDEQDSMIAQPQQK